MNKKVAKIFWLIAIIDLIIIQLSTSTFDSGDSVLHYLQAKQAFQYPKYFLAHWSKPFFVLLASPFAYIGFSGIKLFNTLCVLLSIWYAFKIKAKTSTYAWVILLMGFFVPELFWSQASGLTEPLFAFMLVYATYHYLYKNKYWALILISFLPFVRSEGWLIIPIFGLVELLNKRLKWASLLTVGHFIYGLIGMFYYQDFLWMFHQNPYQGVEQKYGSGDLLHYLEQTPYLMGLPLALLFFGGLVLFFIKIKTNFSSAFITNSLLIYGVVLVFYIAHSLFWYLGLFHSFGLKRVFIAIMPLMLLVATDGLLALLYRIRRIRYKRLTAITVVLTVILFAFTPNKMALGLPKSFWLTAEQELVESAAKWYQDSEYSDRTVSYANHYFGMVLALDMDNPTEYLALGLAKQGYLPVGTIVFWDSYFAETDQGVSSSFFENNQQYLLLKELKINKPKPYLIRIYKVVN